MTMGGAKAMRLEDKIGSVSVGKSADFVILDRNLFAIPIDDVSETRARETYFEGKQVYPLAESKGK